MGIILNRRVKEDLIEKITSELRSEGGVGGSQVKIQGKSILGKEKDVCQDSEVGACLTGVWNSEVANSSRAECAREHEVADESREVTGLVVGADLVDLSGF